MNQISRRTLLKAGLALGATGLTAPAILSYGLGEKPVKLGMDNPLTGTYAVVGDSQLRGAKLAVEELNEKNGILGRPVKLVVEDSAGDVGTAVQKAHKLIDKDGCTFLLGSVSSSVALAISQVAHEKGVIYMDTGGHTTPVTGTHCHWTTFRTCTTTYMLAAAIADTLADKFGKRWYFLTPDYSFGHTEQAAFARILKGMGGTVLGNALAPLGTTDFSSYLIKAEQAKPDVLINLTDGNDLVNSMKQALQFGMNQKMAIGGGLQELEDLQALPPAARIGWWTFEWYWDQPGVPHVKEHVAKFRKKYGKYPTARSWFGYASVHSLALGANKAKTLDQVKVAHTMEGMVLPPEIALEPHQPYFRPGDHQLMADEFPGEVNHGGEYPDLFKVAKVIPGDKITQSVQAKGCHMTFPT